MVYVTRYIDLLWTFYDPGALYNTIFKIIFISSSAYTVYLMLNDYKPTHDPNLDTFKVQYLLGASAVMAILFPYKYTPTEVRQSSNARGRAGVAFEASLTHRRCFGHFQSGWNRLPSFRSSSCCSALARPRRSRPTISSRWVHTELSTFRTGYTATSLVSTARAPAQNGSAPLSGTTDTNSPFSGHQQRKKCPVNLEYIG